MEWIVGGVYFCGAYLHWRLVTTMEAFMTLKLNEEVRVIGWQKTLTTAAWPLVALWLLLSDEAWKGPDNNNE